MKSIPTDGKALRKKRTRCSSIASGRWAAYAAAGVASTVTLAPSVEAEVHYSGIVKYDFAANGGHGSFPLDAGVDLVMRIGVATGGSDYFGHVDVNGADGAFVGHLTAYTSPLASALPERVNVSQQRFAVSCTRTSSGSVFCFYDGDNIGSGFRNRGITFIGFVFYNESGTHYGWARVRLTGAPNYRFQLVDYAWADAGEGLLTGQKHDRNQAEAPSNSGSLGLLAAGGAGLKIWRAEKVAAAFLLVR